MPSDVGEPGAEGDHSQPPPTRRLAGASEADRAEDARAARTHARSVTLRRRRRRGVVTASSAALARTEPPMSWRHPRRSGPGSRRRRQGTGGLLLAANASNGRPRWAASATDERKCPRRRCGFYGAPGSAGGNSGGDGRPEGGQQLGRPGFSRPAPPQARTRGRTRQAGGASPWGLTEQVLHTKHARRKACIEARSCPAFSSARSADFNRSGETHLQTWAPGQHA